MTTKTEIADLLTEIAKDTQWEYVTQAGSLSEAQGMAPDGVEVEEGPQGGFRYDGPESDSGGESDGDGDDDETAGDYEVTETTPESFANNVSRFIEENPALGAMLTEHSPEEMEDYTLLSTEEGEAGIAVSPDGDIQNFYNDGASTEAAGDLFQQAIEEGGVTLDCYDTILPDYYADFGFQETGRMEFNPDYAPEGWSFDDYGQPDVVFMSYQPEEEYEQTDRYYDPSEWDDAKDDARQTADTQHRGGEKGRRIRRGTQRTHTVRSPAYWADRVNKGATANALSQAVIDHTFAPATDE